jgi:hypothetical protein
MHPTIQEDSIMHNITARDTHHRGRSTRTVGRTAVLTASMAVAGLAVSTAVHATPYDQGSYRDEGSEIVDWCPGIELLFSFEARGSWLGRVDPRTGLVVYRDSSRGTNTYTNLDNERSFSVHWTTNSIDMEITAVDDENLTILVQGSGSERWVTDDGKLAFANPGLVRYEILIDHGGTPSDPSDDEWLEFLGVQKGSTGRNDLDGVDFCDVVETLIG